MTTRVDRIDLITTGLTAAALIALIMPGMTDPWVVIPIVVAIPVIARIIALTIAWAAGRFTG